MFIILFIASIAVVSAQVPEITVSIPDVGSVVNDALAVANKATAQALLAIDSSKVNAALKSSFEANVKSTSAAQLSIDAAAITTAAAVASANSAFTASETALTLASTATVDAAVVTAASIQVANEAVLNAQADLATTSVLLLKSNAELKVAAGTTVSAAGLVLESANQVQVASDGVLRCGTIVVGKGKSTIEGSVSMVDKKVVEIASEGQLVLTSAAASTQATVDAALAVQAQAEVLVENSVRLASAARVTGEGALNVAGALALSSENAVRVGTLTVAESGKLQIDAATSVVAEATNKAELAGEAVITAGANVEQVVIKHASRTGEFDKVTVNGQVAATAGASAGRKRAEEAWETTYGEKETTITRTQSNTAAVLLSNIGILMISMVTFINTLLL